MSLFPTQVPPLFPDGLKREGPFQLINRRAMKLVAKQPPEIWAQYLHVKSYPALCIILALSGRHLSTNTLMYADTSTHSTQIKRKRNCGIGRWASSSGHGAICNVNQTWSLHTLDLTILPKAELSFLLRTASVLFNQYSYSCTRIW